MLASRRFAFSVILSQAAMIQAVCPGPVQAQETGGSRPSGVKLRFSFEGEIDWTPKPAAADGEKPASSPGILGGQVRGSFIGTWSLEPVTSPVPAKGSSEKPSPGNDSSARNDKLSEDEQAIVDQTNAERKKAGLLPLAVHPELMAIAREQSKLMAEAKTLSHAVNGRSFNLRLKESKYQSRAAGENCAEGAETPREAVAGWMASPGHKGNILNADYREIGVGLARSGEGRRYYTQVFASPAESPK